jgi:endoglucanase
MHKKLLVVLSAVGMLTLAGCGGDTPTPPVKPDLEPPLSGDYVADFSLGESEEVFASDGWSNKGSFNAVWKKENLTYSSGQMHLSIKDDPTVFEEVNYPYSAGEARTHHLYGYGDYIVKMKPTNVVGSVSTFFTFTYNGDTIDGVKNKHDEIDIEFLGKDTTKVQFNYFVGGVGGHEFMYDLGFDASKDFHEYGFRWEENKITWVVDGKIAREVTGDSTTLPKCPGRIMTSYWPSSADDWSGHFDGATSDTVDYQWIKSSAEGIWSDEDEPVPPFDENVDWDEIDAIETEFKNAWDNDYTIVNEGNETTVTYDRIGAWKQVKSEDAARYARHADTVLVTLKNNCNRDVNARVDVQGDHSAPTGEESSKDCLNTQAYSNETVVTTNLDWGGSSFVIPANKEVTVHVNYDNASETMGAPKSLLFFLDSLQNEYIDVPGTSVTIKDIKFANLDGTPVEPDPKPEPPTPEPGGDVDWDKVEATPLTYWTSSSDIYSFEDNGTNAVTVNYTDATGYACIGSASANAVVDANNTAKVTLRNNNEAVAHVRMDIQVTGGASAISFAEAKGHDEVYVAEGSAFIDVAVNESVDLIVEYDPSLGATNVMFFVDSMGEATSGSVTISDVKFAKVLEPAPGGDVDWDKVDANALTFWASSSEIYSFENNETTAVTVNYTDATGYACIGSASANTVIDANNTVKVTLRNNNGEHAANFRMDVQVTGGASAIQAAYAQGHDDVYVAEGSAFITVAVNETVDLFALYDASLGATNLMFFIDSMGEATSGSVTISDVKFADIETPASESIALTFGTENAYTLDPKGVATNSVNVTYTDMAGNCYSNFGAGLSDVEGKTTFAVTMKNNGEAAVKARVDVKGTTEVGYTNTINTSAYAAGHTEIYTDTEWGGSSIELAAGEEVEFVITFDQTTDRGAATYVMFFLDSFMGTETTHSGNVTLSNFVLA